MRWTVVGVLFALFLASGAMLIAARRSPPLEIEAARRLPANRRIVESDLLFRRNAEFGLGTTDESSLFGHYLKYQIEAHDLISDAALSLTPTISANVKGYFVYAHALDEDGPVASVVDAGDLVDLCFGGGTCMRDYELLL